MDKKQKILSELKALCSHDRVNISNITYKSSYNPINEYLTFFTVRIKPETNATLLLRQLLGDIITEKALPEVNMEGDFIDFVLKIEGRGNPVCIELKPFYRLSSDGSEIIKTDLNYSSHEKQIQKYLRHKQIEYIILTNIDKAYIFNRNALLEFKPFYETTLHDILADFLIYGNIWESVRRYEDNYPSVTLDNEFFIDLKKWFAEFTNVKFNERENLSKEEIIVLFLNKFIFIKTLEDYGLIPYRFIQDQYEDFVVKWKAKGYGQVFKHFFHEMEDFFETYYDTELFNSNFWEFLNEDKNNVLIFKSAFEQIMGLSDWARTFGKGLVHYNYRQINEDIFGKAYETWIAENRKDEGIYYTPATITEYMTDKIVDTLFGPHVDLLTAELKKAAPDKDLVESLIEKIKNIKIVDSSSGSGSFLIKVLRAIYAQYMKIAEATEWVTAVENSDLFSMPENYTYIESVRTKMCLGSGSELFFISGIILNHIFAADKDERAIDTAKTNIWKEAVKLNPNIYNYRWLDDVKVHILPNLEMNFIKGDSLTDFDFAGQVDIIAKEFGKDITRLFEIRNKYIDNPFNPSVLNKTAEIKGRIRNKLMENHQFSDSLFFPLEFFFCFFAPDGNPLPKEQWGFDGIISNPPWEAIKPIKKEFAKQGKYGMDVLYFNKWFDNKLEKDPEFKNNWMKYQEDYKIYTEYLYNKYEKQSSGDPNFYKFFMERDFQLIKNNGYFCLLVPSGFQTDEGANELRKLLIDEYHLIELNSFENRGYQTDEKNHKVKLFPEVDTRFKFSIVFTRKENLNGEKHSFKAKFYLHDPKDLYNGNTITYNIEKIRQFSPVNLSIMEFRSEKDYGLCLKIKGEHEIFRDLGFQLRREFDMTNDSNLFHNFKMAATQKAEPFFRLYEGKMIHQFNSAYKHVMPRYLIKETEARPELFRKVVSRIKKLDDYNENIIIPEDILLDYQTYRLVYRAVGRSTDERTLICTIVPKLVFVGNSLIHLVNQNSVIKNKRVKINSIDIYESLYLMGILNSLILNYYIRNKISANLNMFYIYELPIAEAGRELRSRIINLGFSLLYRKSNKADFEDLKKKLGISPDERDLNEIRAELEVIIAKHLYKLDKSDWEYLTSTFTFGGDSETKIELDEFIRLSREMWDEA